MSHSPEILVEETHSWASAFVDGEVSLADPAAGWSETVHEQLYYYAVTRQVLRGAPQQPADQAGFQSQRLLLTRFWARIDAA